MLDITGLCGTYDGNSGNERRHPDGHDMGGTSDHPSDFIKAWK